MTLSVPGHKSQVVQLALIGWRSCYTRKLSLFEMVAVLYCRERDSRQRETVLIAFTLQYSLKRRAVVGANRLKQPAVAVDE